MQERSSFFEINLVESSSNETLKSLPKIAEKSDHTPPNFNKIRSKVTIFHRKTQMSCFLPTKHFLTKTTNTIKHVFFDSLSKFRFKAGNCHKTRKSRFDRETARRYRPEIRLTTDN